MSQEENSVSVEKGSGEFVESEEKNVSVDNSHTTSTRVLDRKRVYVDLPAYDANRSHRKGFVIDITSRGIGLKKIHTTPGDVIQWVICADEHFPVERFSFVAKCKWTAIDQFNNDPLSGFQIIRISPEDSARLRKFLLFLGSRYFRDLTSNLRAEEALRSVEAQYRSIVDSQKEIIVRFLPDSGLTFVNQAFCNFARKDKDYLIGRNFFDWTLAEPDMDPKTCLSLLTSESPSASSEFALAAPSGDIRYFEWDQKCFFNDDGTAAFYQLIGRDKTSRKLEDKRQDRIRLELEQTNKELLATIEALKKQAPSTLGTEAPDSDQNRSTEIYDRSFLAGTVKMNLLTEDDNAHILKVIADRANFGLAIAQTDGTVIYANNYFLIAHGLSAEDAIGHHLSIFHSPEQLKQVASLNTQVQTEGHYDAQEVWHRHASGRDFPMLMSGSLIIDDKNQIKLLAVSAVDISQIRQMQEALNHSQKMEAIGTLAGGIAHDVNNALFVMTGYADLALGGVEPGSRTANYLNSVLKAGQRIKAMVNQILAFGKGEGDQKKPVHLTPLLKEIVKYMRGAIPQRVRLEEQIDCPNDLVEADTTQMYQLIVNLMVNARDAMMDSGGTLTVCLKNVRKEETKSDTARKLSDGEYLLMTVTDTGLGMTKEIMDRIFDPFFTTKQAGAGLGMGLSMILMILDNHDAVIEVESEPGAGTSFNVYFRACQTDDKKSDSTEFSEEISGSERILFVDDDLAILEMSRQLLELMGYQVTLASSGYDALDLIQKSGDSIDMVITDMTMPGMNGMELAQEIRKIRPQLPVILCSGYTDVFEEDNASDMGIGAFITKPIGRNELSETIRRLLD